MKQLLFVLAAIASTLGVFAQRDFEGKVVYLIQADKDEKKPELTIWFAPNKLKISFKEDEQSDRSYLLVRLDSGKIFTVNTTEKQFTTRMLKTSALGTFVPEKSDILGHPTTSVLLESNSPGTGLGGILSMNDLVYQLADDLYYTVPAQYKGNTELMMVHQNRIALGASIKLSNLFGMLDGTESKVAMITATATMVTPMPLAPNEFEIPAGYTLQVKKDYAADNEAIAPDTAIAMVVDSARVIPPYKKPAKKPSKKPNSKKTSVKSAANRRS